MAERRAFFIVLEGLDGAGTTTQARILHQWLKNNKAESLLTYEPTDGPAGKLIRDALSGKLYSPAENERTLLSERALCLLFAADRLEHSSQIDSSRSRGMHVVCDRYILSSLAYQTLEPSIKYEWVIEVNSGCSIPDLTIFLKVPVEECSRRLKRRLDAPTVYEKTPVLRRIDANYERMLVIYSKRFGPVRKIDGTGEPEAVHSRILEAIRSALPLFKEYSDGQRFSR